MIYQVGDKLIKARGPTDLVAQMHADSFEQWTTDEGWMKSAAKRARMMSGHRISTESKADFVHDMVREGLIKELSRRDVDLIKETGRKN